MTFFKKTRGIINDPTILSNEEKDHFPSYLFPYVINDFINHHMKIITTHQQKKPKEIFIYKINNKFLDKFFLSQLLEK